MYTSPSPPNSLPALPHHADLKTPVQLRQSPTTSDRVSAPSIWLGTTSPSPPSEPLDREDYDLQHYQRWSRLHDRPQGEGAAPYPSRHGPFYEGSSDGDTSPVDTSGSASRPVIPSKRAAQNRAAQRAFRQRRDKYVKDLERKVKEMERWPEEMEQLRNENKQLREKVAVMSQQMAEIAAQTPTSMMSTCSASSIGSIDIGPHYQQPQERRYHAPPSIQQQPPLLVEAPPMSPPDYSAERTPPIHSITPPPVPLCEPYNTVVAPDGCAQIMVQHVNRDEVWAFDNFELDFAFDPCFQGETTATAAGGNSGSLLHQQQQQQQQQHRHQHHPQQIVGDKNGGQVLDNLFEILQTRQRPQIPMQPSPAVHPHAFVPLQATTYVLPVQPTASCNR